LTATRRNSIVQTGKGERVLELLSPIDKER